MCRPRRRRRGSAPAPRSRAAAGLRPVSGGGHSGRPRSSGPPRRALPSGPRDDRCGPARGGFSPRGTSVMGTLDDSRISGFPRARRGRGSSRFPSRKTARTRVEVTRRSRSRRGPESVRACVRPHRQAARDDDHARQARQRRSLHGKAGRLEARGTRPTARSPVRIVGENQAARFRARARDHPGLLPSFAAEVSSSRRANRRSGRPRGRDSGLGTRDSGGEQKSKAERRIRNPKWSSIRRPG